MLCATPLRSLDPSYPAFLWENKEGRSVVGWVDRFAIGYVQVTIIEDGKRQPREFRDSDGELHVFEGSGFRTQEWSANTLVRPISKEEDMSDVGSGLVAEAGTPTAEVRKKVVKLVERSKTKAAASGLKGKLAKVAPKVKAAPKEKVVNKCKCGCGGTTGGTFAPGHDARYFGWLARVSDGRMEFKELNASVKKDLIDIKGVRKALASHKAK